MNDRIKWIDTARAIGIFFVVLGHMNTPMSKYIYSFHMLIFFFISGLLFIQKEEGFVNYLKRKVTSLIIPYFTLAITLFLVWLVVARNIGDSSNESLSITKNIIGIFYAQGGGSYMNWGIPLWFIPCLFIVNLIYYGFNKLQKWIKTLALIAILALSIAFIQVKLRLPWSIDIAFISMPFFFLGHVSRKLFDKLSQTKWLTLLLFAILLIAHYFIESNSPRTDLQSLRINNIPLFYLNAILASFGWILFSVLLPTHKLFSDVGKNTLIILAFHLNVLGLINLIADRINFSISHAYLQILVAIAVCLLFIPASYIINKYFPFIVGDFKTKKK